MRRGETALRIAVIAAALLATAAKAPTLVSAPLALLSLVNGGQLLAYLAPGDDPLERYLIVAGGVAVLLVLLGVALNYVPGGMTRASFDVGWAVVSSALLAAVTTRHALGEIGLHLASISLLASFGLLAAATAVAFQISSAGVRKQSQAPVLALSALAYSGTEARILVSSVNAGGRYELLVLPDGRRSGSLSRLLDLGSKGAHSAELSVRLPPARCYWNVVLRPPGRQAAAERELNLWVGTSSTGMKRSPGTVPPLTDSTPGGPAASGPCTPATASAR